MAVSGHKKGEAKKSRVLVVMGPAGAGKSTVGAAAARRLGVPFFEGDDYHPPGNVAKIRAGQGLSPEDRRPWIAAIAEAVQAAGAQEAVLACSALNERVRTLLEERMESELVFVLLDVPAEELMRRLKTRKGHFAGPDLLKSQLDAMDPAHGIPRLDGRKLPTEIAGDAAALFRRCP